MEVKAMAKYIERGAHILIPFRNGLSIGDSQGKPRIYSTWKAFEKHFPAHYLGTQGVELVEFAEVVRCKDCDCWERHTEYDMNRGHCSRYNVTKHEDGFCDRAIKREYIKTATQSDEDKQYGGLT